MPTRGWQETKRLYNQILLVPSGTKHSSGYMHIAIVGVWTEDKEAKYEICGYPDDISLLADFINAGQFKFAKVRMDCWYPQGILQYHGNGKFRVSESLSSQEITFIERSAIITDKS